MRRRLAEAALTRHRLVSGIALALLVLMAWGWLFAGAGTGMPPLFTMEPPGLLPPAGHGASDMTGMEHMVGMEDMAGMENMAMAPTSAPEAAGLHWSFTRFALTFAMWWVMMVAMMIPSAAPTILLYARTASRHDAVASPPTMAFLAGYLLAWGLFSLLATMLHAYVESAGYVSPMTMAAERSGLVGALLVLAGVYQVTPLKEVCLRRCRHPARFLVEYYRPGPAGALRMGMLHGAYCVGCCWMLMALLFAGGVMNIAWIALITVLVAVEKLLPGGRAIAMATGLGCVVAGLALLILPA